MPERRAGIEAETAASLGHPWFTHYLVRADGRPAAVARRATFDGLSYLSSIGTAGWARGRGLGSLVTRWPAPTASRRRATTDLSRRLRRQHRRDPVYERCRVRAARPLVSGPGPHLMAGSRGPRRCGRRGSPRRRCAAGARVPPPRPRLGDRGARPADASWPRTSVLPRRRSSRRPIRRRSGARCRVARDGLPGRRRAGDPRTGDRGPAQRPPWPAMAKRPLAAWFVLDAGSDAATTPPPRPRPGPFGPERIAADGAIRGLRRLLVA